jgi:hypothetical protein
MARVLVDPIDGFPLDCWVCQERPAVTKHEGRPICDDCLDHFLEGRDDPDREHFREGAI